MTTHDFQQFVNDLCSHKRENEWIELKHNNCSHEEIGEYISALSNSAALHAQAKGYMVWGVDDKTHQIVGTDFLPKEKKIGGSGKQGNQELESWILNHLTPGIEVSFLEGLVNGLPVVVFAIQAAFSHPVRFKDSAFIRVGTYKKKLKDYPEKERKLWEIFRHAAFEDGIAKEPLSDEQVLQELDYVAYFQLMEQPPPDNRAAIIHRLQTENIIKEIILGRYAITNLGAILFANDLERFGRLGRKALRVVIYKGANRVNTIKEHLSKKGYAAGFVENIMYI